MRDHLRFTRDLVALRRLSPALRRGRINVYHHHDTTRVLAFHRWMEGDGLDVVVVVSLAEGTYHGYELGMPGVGQWREVFNGDVYDHWVNPMVAGNGGTVTARDVSMHGMPASASLVIPANGILLFARH